MLALKTDAGSGALEQMVLAEYCAAHFVTHVPKLRRGLRAKLETLMEALNEQFGTAAEFDDPKGGIFLLGQAAGHGRHAEAVSGGARSRRRASIRGRNGRPTRSTPAAGCGCASPARPTRRSARASRRLRKSATANSACPRASPTWRRGR